MPRSPTLPELRFVVVGAESTGKSTFIHNALDLKRSLTLPVASKKMSLEGDVFMIYLNEVKLKEVSVDDDYLVTWPQLTSATNQRIDGVLALYDVSRRDTLAGIPDLLNACSKASLPCVLVACKCDLPSNNRKIDPREVEKSCMKETGIEGCQTFRDRPESHKRCISVVLRNVISNKSAKDGRPLAHTPTSSNRTPQREEQSQRPQHLRAASEKLVPSIKTTTAGDLYAGVAFRANHASDPSSIPAPGYEEPAFSSVTLVMDARETESDPETLHSEADGGEQEATNETSTDAAGRESRPRSRLRPGTPVTIANSLIDGENGSGSDEGDDSTPPVPGKMPNAPAPPSESDGFSLDALVERLVSLPTTKEDSSFNEAFLCLYRKFAAPSQLLAALIKHWKQVEDNEEPHLLKVQAQLRVIALLARWVARYPGDCAYHLTKHYLVKFCERLCEDRIFAAAARETMESVELHAPDEDISWSVSDLELGDDAINGYFDKFPDLQRPSKVQDGEEWFDNVDEPVLLTPVDADGSSHNRAPSTTSGWSSERSASFSIGSFSTVLDSIASARSQAELLTPLSRAPLTKVQWRQFMEYGDGELASELTRMDWIMYSAVQPRDLIRHVSLSTSEKDTSRSLDHLNRMINHFNHVSYWSTNMILLRDKAKHRAKALEKFIEIARKLRVQNNYNSLAAIIAGINGTSIHRLVQTRELVPQATQKELMKLEILMGTRKGYFAYRLAWDNTVGEKIPFLPLHLRDLVATEEGNPTYMGKQKDRINWKKFGIMGETVVSIQQSQGTPYPAIPRNVELQRLILDGRISMDDEELYERSLQVEPRGPNEPRRKLTLFQR